MNSLASLARALGGTVTGRNSISIPTPGHSRADRGTSIKLDATAPGGVLVKSHNGGDELAIKDQVRRLLGLPEWQPDQRKPNSLFSGKQLKSSPAAFRTSDDTAAAYVLGQTMRPLAFAAEPVADVEDLETAAKKAKALAIWEDSVSIAGTLAERYLAHRGLAYQGEALRFHPSCPFGPERLPCMVALVRNIVTDEPQGIHRTALTADGQKIDRKALGPLAGGVVKLTDNADVTLALGLGEGIESTLSLKTLPDLAELPVWACLNAAGLKAFPVLAGIETLWLAVDHDQAGIQAVRAMAERQMAAGVEIITISSATAGADLNDEVRHA